MKWEKQAIEHLHPFGDVLQVGFYHGEAAREIQTYHPRHHTLIESDPIYAKKAHEWIKKHPAVSLIEESWESALPPLSSFDAIFFEGVSLPKPPLLTEGETLIQELEEQFPQMQKLRYSDKELEAFCEEVGKTAPAALGRFLSDLEHAGQIQLDQHQKMVKKYHLKARTRLLPSTPAALYPCLLACLHSHLRKGGRFCSFIKGRTTNAGDPLYEEKVMTNPYLDYKEFSYENGVIFVLEKLI